MSEPFSELIADLNQRTDMPEPESLRRPGCNSPREIAFDHLNAMLDDDTEIHISRDRKSRVTVLHCGVKLATEPTLTLAINAAYAAWLKIDEEAG